MANPHFDRETITEDIGFRGPHFDESIKERFSLGLPGLAQQAQQSWSPQDEYGEHYEHEGFRKQSPVPYGSKGTEYGGKGDNPYGEFTTGPNTVSPFRYPQDDVNILERGPGPWNDFSMGMEPWLMDNDMMDEIELAKIYQSGDPGMINKGSWGSFMPGGDPLWDEVSPQGEAINQILQDPFLQKTIQGLIRKGITKGLGKEGAEKAAKETVEKLVRENSLKASHVLMKKGINK